MLSIDGTTHKQMRWLFIAVTAIVLAVGARAMMQPAAQKVQTAKEITITEGTNFAVAASSDGRTLVADIQGTLWALPAQGGPGKRITEPLLNARQPAFSPKGDQIVFQGFLDDGWDLWSVGLDGSGAKRLTWGPFDDLDANWSHAGTHVAFTSERSGNLDIWILDPRTGAMRQLTNNTAGESLPVWSPDDREIAYVSSRTPSAGIWATNVVDGTERLVAAVTGRVGAPNWTPDGKQVLYTVTADNATRIELSGKPIVTGEDVFPFRADWVSKTEYVYAADGKIKKRALGADKAQTVEFSLALPILRAPLYSRNRPNFDSVKPRRAVGIVRPAVSPDGNRVAFSALGDLWAMDIGSKPTRLTSDRAALNVDPAWSPDGSQLVYSSDRAGTGNLDLWIRDMKTGTERRLTELPTADGQSTWSLDGKRIAFLSILSHAQGADLYVVDVASGKMNRVQRFPGFSPSAPTWSPDGRLLMLAAVTRYSAQGSRAGIYKAMTIPADGGELRVVELTPNSSVVLPVDEGPIWSPDGTRIAFVHQGLLKTVEVDRAGNPVGAIHQLTPELAHAPSWAGDSRRILYLATDQLKMVSIEDGQVRAVPLDLEWRASAATGRTVIHAGRLWNGRDKTLQTDRDIVIEGNRIRAIEPHRAKRPATDRVIDASNRTVIPGLIDMHTHVYQQYGEAVGRQYLAYGVTAARDVGMEAYRSLEYREMWDSGERIGPRLYISGPAFDGTRTSYTEFYTIETGSRVDQELERHRRLGFDLIKMYARFPYLLQRRIVEGAHKAGIYVTSHEIYPVGAYGVDAVEHLDQLPSKASPTGNAYDDVIQVIAAARLPVCPTLNMGSYAVVAADDPSLLTDPRVKALVPDWALAGVNGRMERFKQSGPKQINATLAQKGRMMLKLMKAGVPMVAGTDAPNLPHGQALQVEIESYVRAGLSPWEALQTATVNAAEALGAGADLGSLEPGKLADMVIVTGDPLTDIKSARAISTVIKNGYVYEMNALLPRAEGSRTISNSTSPRR